jgi:hypothetical protein
MSVEGGDDVMTMITKKSISILNRCRRHYHRDRPHYHRDRPHCGGATC